MRPIILTTSIPLSANECGRQAGTPTPSLKAESKATTPALEGYLEITLSARSMSAAETVAAAGTPKEDTTSSLRNSSAGWMSIHSCWSTTLNAPGVLNRCVWCRAENMCSAGSRFAPDAPASKLSRLPSSARRGIFLWLIFFRQFRDQIGGSLRRHFRRRLALFILHIDLGAAADQVLNNLVVAPQCREV